MTAIPYAVPNSVSSTVPTTKELAALGHFRAIALWLNQSLVERGLYAQVQAASNTGCLQIRVEYEHPPEADDLTRFICHRIWHLNSALIEGIHLSVRPVGSPQVAWERRVRIMTPALRQRRTGPKGPAFDYRSSKPSPTSGLPPRLQRPRRKPVSTVLPQTAKTLRAMMLTGSAVAAFIFGCLVEIALSTAPGPSLPLQKQASVTPPRGPEVIQVVSTTAPLAPRSPERSHVVNAALEPVAVIAHDQIPFPTDPTVTLVFGGQVDLDALPHSALQPNGQLLAGVSAYQQADVAMVSLNNSLATAATTLQENFIDRQRPDVVNLLKAGGVDIIDLAGENTMAFGESGLVETLETLDRNGVYRVGAGRNEQEARRPEILDVKGQRIAYLSYNQGDLVRAYGNTGGINALARQALVEDIRALRKEVDWLIVNYRWSADLPERPADWQTNLARLAIDQGADVVVGHHPTQLQGTEIYKGRPIAYSLGDFIFSPPASTPSEGAAILQVSLRDRKMKVDLIPIALQNGQPQEVSGPEAEAILQRVKAASQEFPEPMPASIVLDLQPTAPPPESSPAGDSFIDEGVDPTNPARFPETEAPWKTPETLEADPSLPAPTSPGEASDPFQEPAKTDGQTPMVPVIPEDTLQEWGPKHAPGEERFIPIPEAGEALLPEMTPPANGPVDDLPAEVAPSSPLPGTIAPYGEPLVGPMAVASSPEIAIPGIAVNPEAAIAEARSRLGLPQTRVFPPLTSLTPTPHRSPAPSATTLEPPGNDPNLGRARVP